MRHPRTEQKASSTPVSRVVGGVGAEAVLEESTNS